MTPRQTQKPAYASVLIPLGSLALLIWWMLRH
jgi:hypothetical protein